MGAFGDRIRQFKMTVDARIDVAMPAVVVEAKHAIQFGSSVTGSPGQPVDTGNLRNSWQHEMTSPRSGVVSTTVEYAPAVEDGVGPHGKVTYGKSGVGGSHSVRQLVANFDRHVDSVVSDLNGGGSAEVRE